MIVMRADMAMFKAQKKEHARCQKGNAMVEFALILPIILVLVFGIITYSIALYDKTVLTMATAAGARAGAKFDAAVGGMTNSAITSRVNTAFAAACGTALISFDGTVLPPLPTVVFNATAPRRVTVSATISYTGMYVFSSPVDISATTTMMLEQ